MAVAVLVVISFLPYKLTLIETGRLDENIFIRCMTPLPISLFLFFFPSEMVVVAAADVGWWLVRGWLSNERLGLGFGWFELVGCLRRR